MFILSYVYYPLNFLNCVIANKSMHGLSTEMASIPDLT